MTSKPLILSVAALLTAPILVGATQGVDSTRQGTPKPDSKQLPFKPEQGDRLLITPNRRDLEIGLQDKGPELGSTDFGLIEAYARWRYLGITVFDLRTDLFALQAVNLREKIRTAKADYGRSNLRTAEGREAARAKALEIYNLELAANHLEASVMVRRNNGVKLIAEQSRFLDAFLLSLLSEGAKDDDKEAKKQLEPALKSLMDLNKRKQTMLDSKTAFEVPVGTIVRLVQSLEVPIGEADAKTLGPHYGQTISLAKVRVLEGSLRRKEMVVEYAELTNDVPLEDGQGFIYEASTPASFKEAELVGYLDAKASGDSATAKRLLKGGRIFSLNQGEAVQVVQWGKLVRVKVLTGQQKGKTFWVSHRNVSTTVPPKPAKGK